MRETELNRFTTALGDVCQDRVTDEKWVIAPSIRIGLQWLGAIARHRIGIVNARVKTLSSIALDLASPEMKRQGLCLASAIRTQAIVDNVFSRKKQEGELYLTKLRHTPGIIQSIARAIHDLRLAGLTAEMVELGPFEVRDKGREIKSMLAGYEREMKADKLIDRADALRMAVARLRDDPHALPAGAVLIAPRDLADDLKGLERELWLAVPEDKRLVLEVDGPNKDREHTTDLARLAWIAEPARAAPPVRDNTASIFRAVGPVNEVREVLRRIASENVPFDDVEIIHTDSSTYLPLIYELVAGFSDDLDRLPVTFAEGIPVRYSRPGRALMGWASWIKEDYPPAVLARMIQDGLFRIGAGTGDRISFAKLAANLRAAPIGGGRDRYLPILDRQIESLKKREKSARQREEGKGEALKDRIEALEAVRALAAELLELSRPGQGQAKFLLSALAFLNERARSAGQIDEYSLHSMRRDIRDLADCAEQGEALGLDELEWIFELPLRSTVGGLGPRPGRLFVSPIGAGGHSGRGRVFVIGLDDARFPGAGAQDPLLLDAERSGISKELGTSGARLAKKSAELVRLLARLRGRVTLSYSCKDLVDDRETFPAPALISAYRILSGDSEGSLEKMNNWLGDPASFAPSDPTMSIDPTQWWLSGLCGDERPESPETAVSAGFANLGQGMKARAARDSDEFTEYDGHVPRAGKDADPSCEGGPVMSSSRLETLAQCPMEYFFRYILEIEPPEEYVIDPEVWLDPSEKGSLLHDAFRRFMAGLCAKDLTPELKRDLPVLEGIIEDEIREWLEEKPIPSAMVFEREKKELYLTARIFLQEEEEHCQEHQPRYFEAAIGMSQDSEPTPLDAKEPVRIELPNGRTILGRGRIDRVDEIKGSAGKQFSIHDYKTGSAHRYRQSPPFWCGRCIQNAFYLALGREALARAHPGAQIRKFGYFFPGGREHGERIEWSCEELEDGARVLAMLCDMISRGSFPFTNDLGDVKYSDYLAAFGDQTRAALDVARKLANRDNKALDPFRKLRGLDGDD